MATGVAWRGGRVGTELNGCILDDLGFLMSVMNLRADVEQEAGHTGFGTVRNLARRKTRTISLLLCERMSKNNDLR